MPEALPLQPGDPRRLGEYEITGRLGVGEQGAVFLGAGPAGRVVAVKLLHARLSGEPVARSRFTGAFTTARKVAGFCAAAILDADVDGDRAYVVSEYVDGPSLQQLVEDEGPRGGAVVERLAIGLAISLAAVHRAGALHLDLKPGNVLLGQDGPQMSDFGIVRALESVNAGPTGNVTVDPAYKAPEQLSGMGIGPAADVFAWAATLLFAATGKAPFGDDSPSEVMQRIMYDDPDLSALPDTLCEVAADALAKDAADRPPSKGLLQRLLDESGPLAARMPEYMVEEGRALVQGLVPSPRRGGRPASAPSSFGATPRGVPAPPSSGPAPGASAQPPSPAPVPRALAPAPDLSSPSRPSSSGSPSSGSVTDLDPAAFEPTAMFRAVDSDSTTTYPVVSGGGADAPGQTATFDRVDDAGPHEGGFSHERGTSYGRGSQPDSGDRTELIPGLRSRETGEGRVSPPSLPKIRRPSNHVLGVALSLSIGVGVGIAIITLVLWPQLKDDDTAPPADNRNASENHPVTTIPASFGGTWRGTMVNTVRNTSFPIEVTFEAGGTTARAVYPREKCTGTLKLSRGTGRDLEMALTVGKPCTSGNVQVRRQDDGTLQYSWSKPKTQLGYAGKLSRN